MGKYGFYNGGISEILKSNFWPLPTVMVVAVMVLSGGGGYAGDQSFSVAYHKQQYCTPNTVCSARAPYYRVTT